VYGQKTTGHKTTRTKGHHRRNFVVHFDEVYNELCASKKWRKVPGILASAQTDMFAAEHTGWLKLKYPSSKFAIYWHKILRPILQQLLSTTQ